MFVGQPIAANWATAQADAADSKTAQLTIDYGDGTPVSGVTIIEVGPDGKAVRQRDYFGYPFEAPEWRAKFTEAGEKVTTS